MTDCVKKTPVDNEIKHPAVPLELVHQWDTRGSNWYGRVCTSLSPREISRCEATGAGCEILWS